MTALVAHTDDGLGALPLAARARALRPAHLPCPHLPYPLPYPGTDPTERATGHRGAPAP